MSLLHGYCSHPANTNVVGDPHHYNPSAFIVSRTSRSSTSLSLALPETTMSMSVATNPTVESPKLVAIEREGPLFILTMLQEQNLLTPELCKAICDGLDLISATVRKEKMKEAALITRGTGKFYSYGLHLETALADPSFSEKIFMPMLNKILLFGIPTVACIQG